jgi:hypothetical protein
MYVMLNAKPMSNRPLCAMSGECAAPFQQGVRQTGAGDAGGSAKAFNEFSYAAQGVMEGASGSAVWLQPFCAYVPETAASADGRLALDNMCPALRSGGVDCRDTSPAPKCRFLPGECAASRSRAAPASTQKGRCEYDLDLLQTPADVSYLLRSTGTHAARLPVMATAALVDDWARRMQQAADAGEPVTRAAVANAYCMAAKQRTLGTLQPGHGGDWQGYRDYLGDDWGRIYWKQAKWLTALMTRPVDDLRGAGGSCIVRTNCTLDDWQSAFC